MWEFLLSITGYFTDFLVSKFLGDYLFPWIFDYLYKTFAPGTRQERQESNGDGVVGGEVVEGEAGGTDDVGEEGKEEEGEGAAGQDRVSGVSG